MSKRAHLPTPAAACCASEGLDDILALSRLSGVTVVFHEGFQSAAALLQAAQIGSRAGETVFLFDEWQRIDEPDLADALRQTIATASQTHASARIEGVSVLAILDRFEDHLALPPDHPRALADAQTLCALATAVGTDIHCLLLVAESAAPLLQRYAARIPGMDAASLHMPAHGPAFDASRFGRPRDDDAHGHARRFGTLLERLTERTDAVPPAAMASTERDIEERATMRALQPPQFAELREDASATAAHDAAVPLLQEFNAGEPAPVRALAPAVSIRNSSPDLATLHVADAVELSVMSVAMPYLVEAPAMPPRHRLHAALAGIALIVLGLMLASRFPPKLQAQATQALAAPSANPASGAPKEADAEPRPAPSAAMTAAADATAPEAASVLHGPPLSHAEASAAADQAPASNSNALPDAASDAWSTLVHAEGAQRPAAPPAATHAPTLFILGGGKGGDRRMQALVRSLARQGIGYVRMRPGSSGPKSSELRYFHAEARDDALSVRRALVHAGFRAPQVRLAQRHDKEVQPRQLELWLAGERGARLATPKSPRAFAGANKPRKLSAATAAPRMHKAGRG